MATQTIEFRAPTAQAVTAKLFAIGSDTQVASASATEATNRKGTYAAAFTDVAAGTYELIALVGSIPVARWFVTLTLTTATFQSSDINGTINANIVQVGGETITDDGDGRMETLSTGSAVSDADINEIVSRVQAVSGGIIAAQYSSALYIVEGDTWTQDIESLGNLSGKTIVFMIKKDIRDTDANAVVTIHETDGLTRLNAAIPSDGQDEWGSIEILDSNAGDIRLRLESDATVRLKSGTYVDGVKLLADGADATVRQRGKTIVSAGPINAIS
jgi:hypothetical protein